MGRSLCMRWAQGSESMAQRLQLLAHGAGERLVLVQVPDLLPSEAPPPAPDPGAPRQRSLRREDLPPAALARGLKALPSGKACRLLPIRLALTLEFIICTGQLSMCSLTLIMMLLIWGAGSCKTVQTCPARTYM